MNTTANHPETWKRNQPRPLAGVDPVVPGETEPAGLPNPMPTQIETASTDLTRERGTGPARSVREPEIADLLKSMAKDLPISMTQDWLAQAMKQTLVAGAPGGMLDAMLKGLGIDNPLADGPVASVLALALKKAGVGELSSLLPSAGSALMGGSTAGLADALGTQALSSALNAAGLGKIPGAGAAAKYFGDQIGDSIQDLFLGDLDAVSDALSGLADNPFAATTSNLDLSGIGAGALNEAADHLLSQWKVDDESSAAEHIAQKAVKDNKDAIKDAVKDPDGFAAKVRKFFSGEPVSVTFPVSRITDMDSHGDIINMGVATILVEGLPVARMTDTVVGPMAPAPAPVLQGVANVTSAGLPTAFMTATTAAAGGILVKGAGTVWFGPAGSVVTIPAPPTDPSVTSNAAPAAPASSVPAAGAATPPTEQSANGNELSDETADQDSIPAAGPETSIFNDGVTEDSDADKTQANASFPGFSDEDPGAGGICVNPLTPLEQVTADGKVTAEEHLNRNVFNRCPVDDPGTGVSDDVNWWRKTPDDFHKPLYCYEGQPVDGRLGPSSYECCYHPADKKLVDNVAESGTFNFYGTGDSTYQKYGEHTLADVAFLGGLSELMALIQKYGAHTFADVAPHVAQNVLRGKDYSHVNMTLAPVEPPDKSSGRAD